MNRRAFLTRLAKGAVSTAVLLHIPSNVVLALSPAKGTYTETVALEFLRQLFYSYCRINGKPPESIALGVNLYDRVEQEMPAICRYVRTEDLMTHQGQDWMYFKGTKAYRAVNLSPWVVDLEGSKLYRAEFSL